MKSIVRKSKSTNRINSGSLSVWNVIFGNFLSLISFLDDVEHKHDLYKISGYKLFEKFKTNTRNSNWVAAVYKNASNKKVFVKRYFYKYKDINYHHILNMAFFLTQTRYLQNQKHGSYTVKFPKVVDFNDNKNNVTLVTEFCEGKPISEHKDDTILEVLGECLIELKSHTSRLNKEIVNQLPKRTPLLIFLNFNYLLLKSFVKDLKSPTLYIKILATFYKHAITLDYFRPEYSISHRDLTPDNILIDRNTITILDTEYLVIGDSVTDLAITPRMFLNKVEPEKLISLLNKNLNNTSERNRFMALSLYYTVLTLSVSEKKSRHYNNSKLYLKEFFENIAPKVFEIIDEHNREKEYFCEGEIFNN
ncbi:hypothetical protein A2714_03890 [Candidatus Woesebacteria bacterium RIFCSPHIGHO2_01_FULL_38_9]|uniref:Protein kinase domain-containing protein n=2 Tax=Candidatus Woeseibacteriota TaxID=1752722 RepID=A0A1F7XZL8_9BACT|nr:MAG: hypothetical protein A2714_03890 [Candidatus Woesebacteria bacterium RIFCSPHIGHO2_01_FULL_38_9]OGM60052.1 MAG: hypothetical protein A3A75_01460 [Candidatus Woesebacteria bacterium RIFCSPLOWO2_01_FULL_39_10]